MAVPSVDLLNSDGLTFRFSFHPSICSFTANLQPKPFLTPLLVVASLTCTVHNSSSSSFEVYFSQASFVFPHSELKKFEAFLSDVQAAKEVA